MAFLMAARICVLRLAMALTVVPRTYAQTVTCERQGLIDTMSQDPRSGQLSTLLQFINQAGLTDTINQTSVTGNVTFLAPNNDAFNAFNVTLQQNNLTFANITDKNNDRAASILLYHVITGVGALDTTKVPNGFNGQSLTTMLPGHNLTLSIAANLMKMIYAENDLTFIGAANNATNTYDIVLSCTSEIYIVDSVLLPNATITSIPVYASGASTLAIAGRWTFVLSSALAAALMI